MPDSESSTERRRRLILAAVRAVPAGQVASYGAIARRAGFPRNARLVARVLASCDDPELPWYRIVRSDGCVALPSGSEAYREQCERLRAEGVMVQSGRVRVQREAEDWLDEVLWGG